MTKVRDIDWKVRSELSFWACFAVVMALLSQALFPPQVMAQTIGGQTRFVLCGDTLGAAPIVDKASEKLFATTHKSKPYQGLKCANCVIASVTALPAPSAASVPASHAIERVDLRAEAEQSPIQPRAPPRPHSCGPPSKT